MKKVILAILLLLCTYSANAQQAITWKTLSNITWKKQYVDFMGGYYDVPRFGTNIEALDNKEISIKGFYVPIDMEETFFALSKSQSSMCFFCGGDGLESVVEILVKKGYTGFKRIKTDKYIEVKGTLVLNRNDPEHLMYVLKNAELVTVIK